MTNKELQQRYWEVVADKSPGFVEAPQATEETVEAVHDEFFDVRSEIIMRVLEATGLEEPPVAAGILYRTRQPLPKELGPDGELLLKQPELDGQPAMIMDDIYFAYSFQVSEGVPGFAAITNSSRIVEAEAGIYERILISERVSVVGLDDVCHRLGHVAIRGNPKDGYGVVPVEESSILLDRDEYGEFEMFDIIHLSDDKAFTYHDTWMGKAVGEESEITQFAGMEQEYRDNEAVDGLLKVKQLLELTRRRDYLAYTVYESSDVEE